RRDELLRVLKVAMPFDRFGEKATRVELRAVCGTDYADLALRNDRGFRYRHAKQVRVNRPESRRHCPELNAFDAALRDKGNRVLEIIVRVLRAVGRKDSSGGHRLAVNGFDDAHLVRADFDQRDFAHDLLRNRIDEVETELEHSCLDADLAFDCDDATGRHLRAKVAALFDGDLSCANVDQKASQDKDEDQKRYESNYNVWNEISFHG